MFIVNLADRRTAILNKTPILNDRFLIPPSAEWFRAIDQPWPCTALRVVRTARTAACLIYEPRTRHVHCTWVVCSPIAPMSNCLLVSDLGVPGCWSRGCGTLRVYASSRMQVRARSAMSAPISAQPTVAILQEACPATHASQLLGGNATLWLSREGTPLRHQATARVQSVVRPGMIPGDGRRQRCTRGLCIELLSTQDVPRSGRVSLVPRRCKSRIDSSGSKGIGHFNSHVLDRLRSDHGTYTVVTDGKSPRMVIQLHAAPSYVSS